MNYFLRIVLVIFALVFASAALASTSSSCLESVAKPPFLDLRPTRTALCPYDYREVVARIIEIATNRLTPYTVEAMEEDFSIPEMTTSYDSSRTASYVTILSGQDGWELHVSVEEYFTPLDSGPEKFVPGLRPIRLGTPDEANLLVMLNFNESFGASSPNHCIPIKPLFEAFIKAGWKDTRFQGPPPTDGGERTPSFGYGNKQVSISGFKAGCAGRFMLMQHPAQP